MAWASRDVRSLSPEAKYTPSPDGAPQESDPASEVRYFFTTVTVTCDGYSFEW
jgi:hypothetical protein